MRLCFSYIFYFRLVLLLFSFISIIATTEIILSSLIVSFIRIDPAPLPSIFLFFPCILVLPLSCLSPKQEPSVSELRDKIPFQIRQDSTPPYRSPPTSQVISSNRTLSFPLSSIFIYLFLCTLRTPDLAHPLVRGISSMRETFVRKSDSSVQAGRVLCRCGKLIGPRFSSCERNRA